MADFIDEENVVFIDRRSVPRAFANDLLCKIVSAGLEDGPAHANIINIGSFGLMVALKQQLPVAGKVVAELFLPLPFGEVALDGIVSWVAKEEGHYLCGIDFTEQKNANGLETLKKYVASIIKDTNIVERRKSRAPRSSRRFVERRAKRPR